MTAPLLAPPRPEYRPSIPASAADSPIADAVLEALGYVRKTRLIDMYDRETVMLLAASFGYSEAMEWMVEHRHLYFIALAMSTATITINAAGREVAPLSYLAVARLTPGASVADSRS